MPTSNRASRLQSRLDSRPDSRGDSRLKRATFAVLALLFAVWLAENLGAERFGFTALLLYLPQHGWGVLPLALLIWSTLKRQWRLALVNAVSLALWAYFLLGFVWHFPARKSPSTLRLMTYNIARGGFGIAKIEAAIRAQSPDIICLQESQGNYQGRHFTAGAQLAARFKGWNSAQSGDVITISRFPIVARRDTLLRGTRRILDTTLQTPRGKVRILNIHVSTSFAGQFGPPYNRMGKTVRTLASAGPAAQTRLEQIAPLQNALKSGDATLPLLMVGDFNSPPHGIFYRAISRNLTDAWRAAGRGSGASFPAKFPLLPIDHALSRGLKIENATIPAASASDHRPMTIDFRF